MLLSNEKELKHADTGNNSRASFQIKETNLKTLQTTWICFYNIFKNTKLWWATVENRAVVIDREKEWEKWRYFFVSLFVFGVAREILVSQPGIDFVAAALES